MIRLLLVDDQNFICVGLKAILEVEPDLEVVGIAENGETAIEQVAALQPDLVLMDIQMPVMDGQVATRAICEQFPNVKVLVFSTFDDNQYVIESLKAGAMGYLLKDMPPEALVQAIRLASCGYTLLGPTLLAKLVTSIPDSERAEALSGSRVLAGLTPREQEVLHLISDGSTNREIAAQLEISEGTVKTHVTHLLDRLHLRNRAQLAIYANSIFKGSACSCKPSTHEPIADGDLQ
jgi:DNA-binding NarL/FixJ family response regulator